MDDVDDPGLVEEQLRYYRARAPEYDEWWERRGRYAFSEETERVWWDDVEEVRAFLRARLKGTEALELACGTGIWTQFLAEQGFKITAVDASPEMLGRNAERLAGQPVEYIAADIFEWQPERRYDLVFFGFWLTHVPPSRVDAFLAKVASALRPGGGVAFIDNAAPSDNPSQGTRTISPGVERRTLNDGRQSRIVKVFRAAAEIAAAFAAHGVEIDVRTTRRFFIYGA